MAPLQLHRLVNHARMLNIEISLPMRIQTLFVEEVDVDREDPGRDVEGGRDGHGGVEVSGRRGHSAGHWRKC